MNCILEEIDGESGRESANDLESAQNIERCWPETPPRLNCSELVLVEANGLQTVYASLQWSVSQSSKKV